MSKFDDDIARGCLPTGEPLECLYGAGWWTEEKEPRPNPEPVDLYIAHLETRITELEMIIDQLIDIGDYIVDDYCNNTPTSYGLQMVKKWQAIIRD